MAENTNHRPKDAVTVGTSKDSVVTHFFLLGNFWAAALASDRNCTLVDCAGVSKSRSIRELFSPRFNPDRGKNTLFLWMEESELQVTLVSEMV